MKFLVRGLWITCTLALLLALLLWLFLSSALFSSLRTGFVETLIAQKTGQDVRIEDEVRLGLGRDVQVFASGLVLPGSAEIEANLAVIDALEFKVSAKDLFNRKVSLSGVFIDGIALNLITDADGTTNWSSIAPDNTPENAPEGDTKKASHPDLTGGFSGLLSDRTVQITGISVLYQSGINGLDLDLQLPELTLNRDATTDIASATGVGTLNAEPFDLRATFPANDPFNLSVEFEHITIAADQIAEADGLQVAANIEIDELGQLLDVAKLNRVLEGSGHVAATFKSADGVARIDDLDILATLDSGQSFALTGQIGALNTPEDVSLTTRIRLYPQDAEPAPAESRYDLKLVAVDMVIDSVPGQVTQRQMVIETNGFTLDTAGEGPPPIKFSDVSRTPDGALRVGTIEFRVGDLADPFITVNGSVEDALQLQKISAEGQIDIPAKSLISQESPATDDQLGTFSGTFHLNGGIDELSLTDLDAGTSETEVWDLRVSGTVNNVLKFENMDLAIDVAVPSGADLLAALSLEPVDTGPTRLGIRLSSQGTNWDVNADADVADSVLKITADLDDAKNEPILIGNVESDLIKIQHVKTIAAATMQLLKLGSADPAPDTPETEGPLRDVTLKPIGHSILFSGMNMDVAINLRQIEGAKGISSIQTDVKLNKSELSAGPLKFEYGGGQFDVSGHMDLTDATHVLNLSGKAGGWQLNDILHSLNLNKGASGTIYADFAVAGGIESAKHFISTMNGSATVSMRDGSVETQLLDLAGLGLLPWVFTKEKQKVAPIVCLRAPISISNGTISTKQTTLETDHVQVVVFGGVNLAKKSIDLDLQPRKIGKPLSRSPWPVTLTGSMTKPKVKVKDGPKRLKRSDGADTMPAQRQLCVPDILQLQ